ncbi:MAG: four helix bundle protein [Gemmataceae bacterium]
MEPCATKFDLEERTYQFARRVRTWCKLLPLTIGNIEDSRQLIRSSGSVGANYIEANEPLGTKDFLVHIKMCRKESKESRYWLRLLDLESKPMLEEERDALIQEATELLLIFAAIIQKRTNTS